MSQIKIFGKRRYYHSLVATALLTGGIFQFIAPVLADGTAAGTQINNTATATYQDPNNPGTTINATSNTVQVTVAKVAGITVTGSGITDTTNPGGQVKVGDSLFYNYSVTNVGNDQTQFRIPNLATVTGPGTAGTVQISYDGGNTWTNISGSEVITNPIAVGGSVQVRVPVTITNGANPGDVVKVQLGDVPGDAQNQPRNPTNGADVYTVDVNDAAGPAVNGVREASATQQTSVGGTPKTTALATVLKTRTGFNNGGNSQQINGDVLTYGLALRVEQSDVTNTGITPAPLAGTSINLDGATATRILVSDAIPANTVLTGTPTAPPGWKVIYTTTATTTTADKATWVSTAPPSGITRVGFVNDPASITSVPTGQTVSGFTVQVQVQGVAGGTTSVTIGNIAQVFGTTSGDTTNTLITDDSGDQNPDNFNSTTKSITSTPDSGTVPSNPTNVDTGNNNTGTSQPGGDANVYTISAAAASSVLNGPYNAPNAVGPTDNNDDFTNKSALVPANTPPGSLINPSGVAFTNTVQNTGTSPATISLLPAPPATPGDLPTNSTVTISYSNISATYSYDGTKFNFVSGNGTSANTPVQITGVAANATANYGVGVQLPNGTSLSTDTGKGFPVPITAFIGSVTVNGQNSVPATSDPTNNTIDRIYTGFLKMLKQSQVLQGTGPAVTGTDGTLSTTPKHPAPGNIVQYQIQYTNISTPQAGTGNIILNASNVVITEDGTQTPNNWALDNDNNGVIDTSNISGTAQDSASGNITFFNGNPATTSAIDQTGTTVTTDVTKYVDTVPGQVAPGASQTFKFQRKMN